MCCLTQSGVVSWFWIHWIKKKNMHEVKVWTHSLDFQWFLLHYRLTMKASKWSMFYIVHSLAWNSLKRLHEVVTCNNFWLTEVEQWNFFLILNVRDHQLCWTALSVVIDIMPNTTQLSKEKRHENLLQSYPKIPRGTDTLHCVCAATARAICSCSSQCLKSQQLRCGPVQKCPRSWPPLGSARNTRE